MRKRLMIVFSLMLTICMLASCKTVPDHLKLPNYSSNMTLGTYKNLEYSLLQNYDDEEMQKNAVFDAVMIEIMENSTYTSYPENRIARLVGIANDTVTVYAQNNNMTPEEFLKQSYGFESVDAYNQYVRYQAQSYFQVRMTIFEIARQEHMTVTQEEFDAARAELLAESELPEAEFEQNYDNEDILFRAVYPKVRDFLYNNSTNITKIVATTQPSESTTEST